MRVRMEAWEKDYPSTFSAANTPLVDGCLRESRRGEIHCQGAKGGKRICSENKTAGGGVPPANILNRTSPNESTVCVREYRASIS